MSAISITKGYTGTAIGQIHWRVWEPAGHDGKRDILCLHPSPFSGLAYQNLAPHLASDRRVIAPDYPGYGGSDTTETPSVEHYAELMLAVADDLGSGGPVDLIGFHSGCFVAAEIACMRPDRVAHLCMVDVPAFAPEQTADLIESHKDAFVITDELSCLDAQWEQTFKSRLEPQGRSQAFAMFAEQLRSGERRNEAAIAAFAYPWSERFPQIDSNTLILATQSMLLDETRHCAKAKPGVTLIERLDITRSVLDAAAPATAQEIRAYLDDAS